MSGAEAYYREGFHDFKPMPEMPSGNPWKSIEQEKTAEQEIRAGNIDHTVSNALDPYWRDFIELFRIHMIFEEMKKRGDDLRTERSELRRVVRIMTDISPTYRLYILGRLERKQSPIRDLFE
jgi:thymidylate synthase